MLHIFELGCISLLAYCCFCTPCLTIASPSTNLELCHLGQCNLLSIFTIIYSLERRYSSLDQRMFSCFICFRQMQEQKIVIQSQINLRVGQQWAFSSVRQGTTSLSDWLTYSHISPNWHFEDSGWTPQVRSERDISCRPAQTSSTQTRIYLIWYR